MALHKDFPDSPYAVVDPELRWFPADEALREMTMDKLMPPLVAPGRRKIAVKVVDIFGNDTMTIVEVSVGGNGGRKS